MKELILIMPEIFLALTLIAVVAGEITYHGEELRLISSTSLVGLAAAFIQAVLLYQHPPAQIFHETLSVDGLSLFFKLLFIALGALGIITAIQTKEISPPRRAEYCALILASCLAMCLAASACDLLMAFLALQLMNVLGYFLAGYGKRSVLSTEAGVKYMVFGAVSAAFFLYGLALLFGSTHSLNIYEIHKVLAASPLRPDTMLVIFILIFLSLSFQFAAFPMHLWAPDVFEGAPTPVSAFLSFGVRAAGLVVALRFLIVLFAQPGTSPGAWQVLGSVDWTKIVALVSGLTMTIGALLAFRQTGAKRLVGYLALVSTGHLLLGLLVLDQVGITALLFNLVIELFALIGTFFILSVFFDEIQSDRLSDLRGMLNRAVPECICLVLFLLCLVGLPPTPGFVGKFALVGVAIRHHWPILGMLAIGAMALSTVAVARLAYHLMGDLNAVHDRRTPTSFPRKVFLVALLAPMILSGVFAQSVLDWASRSLGFILW